MRVALLLFAFTLAGVSFAVTSAFQHTSHPCECCGSCACVEPCACKQGSKPCRPACKCLVVEAK